MEYPESKLTSQIILAAIEVHRHLGPGLLESAYEHCLCQELEIRQIPYERQTLLPVVYKGTDIDCGYRIDLLVDQRVVIELKCTEKILPIHEAQLMTYLRLANKRVGLIMNFHCQLMKDGIKRMVL